MKRIRDKEKQKMYYRRHYAKHSREIIRINSERRKKKKEFIQTLKNLPCADCGMRYPHYVMDFDHVNGDKEYNVSLMGSHSRELILKEISKCDLVCSNCHRERTHKRNSRIV